MKQPKTSKDIPWHQTHEKLHSNAPPWHTVASNQTSQVWAGSLASFDHGHKSLRICCWHPKARGQMIHRWCVADTSVLWDRAFLELCRWCCNKHWVCSAGNHFFNRKEGGSCKITFNQFTETFTPNWRSMLRINFTHSHSLFAQGVLGTQKIQFVSIDYGGDHDKTIFRYIQSQLQHSSAKCKSRYIVRDASVKQPSPQNMRLSSEHS